MNKTKSAHSMIVGLFLLAFSLPMAVYSAEPENAEKEEIRILEGHQIGFKQADRVQVLTKFLEKYNSPFVGEAETFVRVADEKNLDYRLLPAISCMESTCGRFVLPDTYNAWGWGMSELALRNGTYIRFNSWEEGIETVGEGIAKNYADRGLDTPEKMAPVYTPPNYVNWNIGVRFFMGQMDDIALSI
jgi:hypothetical protein